MSREPAMPCDAEHFLIALAHAHARGRARFRVRDDRTAIERRVSRKGTAWFVGVSDLCPISVVSRSLSMSREPRWQLHQ